MGQYKYDGVNSLVSAGVDYTPSIIMNTLTLSAGYKEFSVLNNRANTITLGVGLNVFGASLDYAYEKVTILSTIQIILHQLGLIFNYM